MTIQPIGQYLKALQDSIRRFPEAMSRSMPLTAASLDTQPLCNWRDYDVPTFKRRRIRLSIAQETARH